MLKNFLIVAWRNLVRQKGLSFISIFGLALGIACFSVLVLYAMNEFGFDGFHQHAAQIYRAYDGDSVWTPKQEGSIITPMPLGPAMKQDLTDVEDYMRYIQSFEAYLKVGNETDRENIAYADPSFFTMFSFPLRYGNGKKALPDMHNIVLTGETAKRLFGTANAVGKTLQIKVLDASFATFTVSGVLEDLPANSYFNSFSMLAPFQVFESGTEGRGDAGNWGRESFQTFVQLKPGSKLPGDRRRLSAFKEKYVPGAIVNGKKTGNWIFGLEPLTRIHTDVAMGAFMNSYLRIPPVDPTAIWILVAIAVGVLLIACINFTTLAVGRSANRAREVGVRKVIGGSRGSIRWQFLVEAYLLTFMSAGLGFLMARWLLPFFGEIAGRELHFSFSRYPLLPWVGVALLLGVGLLAGGYPALILSRFRAVEVLKSRVKLGGANFFTKVLVTTQFVLSIGLIIATVVITQQLHYMQTKDPGFNKENVVVIKAQSIPDTRRMYAVLRQELAGVPQVLGVAAADKGMGYREGMDRGGVELDGGKSFTVYMYGVDASYLPVMGMHLLAGRNFDPSVVADTLRSVVINETMMKQLGWTPAAAIGRRLKGMHSGDTASPPVVIGVVKDINFLSMSDAVEPQVFHEFRLGEPVRFFVRLRPGDPSVALAAIAAAWRGVAPDYRLKDNFLDEDLDRFYTAETRLSHIVGWAGGISIFLACLGLFGLAALATINRTKEIGIRKLLGASVVTVVSLISRDFVRLVIVAFLIAAPLAWYFMSNWLQGFYFRIRLEWWVFGLAGIGIAGIAWVTVAGLAARAGMTNPVKSLRAD